ncbi:MAG: MBL fold metallo-hydrolase [Bacteroidia bacterium]|nr:MBL fold metallo-hydrolase [Bacteroidia bacterium]
MKIHFLNHASVFVEIGSIRLLTDPWFFDTCFQKGWGLRFHNEKAFEFAQTASHLWISHFHSDHFHTPTLKRIQEINPEIVVLGNHSYNFQLDETLRNLGFKQVISLKERKIFSLSETVKITRYPTTGIDNMLFIQSPEGNILNYNDCNLPPLSRKLFARKLKDIDIFMTNFNHAGKLLIYPPKSPDEIKTRLKNSFRNNYDFFEVKYIFPFASHHYYRAPESLSQNDSLLQAAELLSLDERILNLNIGDTLSYDKKTGEIFIENGVFTENEKTVLSRGETIPYSQLEETSKIYCQSLRKHFGWLAYFMPAFYLKIADLGIQVNLDIRRGIRQTRAETAPHITAHSEAIYNWFSSPFGTDSFVVGAHFEISNENKIPLKWQIVLGLLIDNKLSIKSIFRMLRGLSGIQFLYNRREEIAGILLQRKLHADYHD